MNFTAHELWTFGLMIVGTVGRILIYFHRWYVGNLVFSELSLFCCCKWAICHTQFQLIILWYSIWYSVALFGPIHSAVIVFCALQAWCLIARLGFSEDIRSSSCCLAKHQKTTQSKSTRMLRAGKLLRWDCKFDNIQTPCWSMVYKIISLLETHELSELSERCYSRFCSPQTPGWICWGLCRWPLRSRFYWEDTLIPIPHLGCPWQGGMEHGWVDDWELHSAARLEVWNTECRLCPLYNLKM